MKDLALPRGQLVSKVLDEDSPSRCHAPFHHLDCCHFIRWWSVVNLLQSPIKSNFIVQLCASHCEDGYESYTLTGWKRRPSAPSWSAMWISAMVKVTCTQTFVIVSVIGCVIVFVSLWFSAMVEVSCAQIFCTQGNQPVTQRQDPIWPGPGRPGLGSWFHSSPEKGFDWESQDRKGTEIFRPAIGREAPCGRRTLETGWRSSTESTCLQSGSSGSSSKGNPCREQVLFGRFPFEQHLKL